MRIIEDYDEIKVTENKPTLQVGGYECIIKNVKHFEYNGVRKVSLELDIATGEFKDYYQNKYDERGENAKYWDDGATLSFLEEPKEDKDKSYFKGLLTAIQSYNPNYKWNWDEKTLIGKNVIAVFGEEEYKDNDGNVKVSTKVVEFRSLEAYQKGLIKVPEFKKLPVEEPVLVNPVVNDDDCPW